MTLPLKDNFTLRLQSVTIIRNICIEDIGTSKFFNMAKENQICKPSKWDSQRR